jgi:ankyrin repeat protein
MSANAVIDHSTAAAAVSAPALSVDDDPASSARSQLPLTVASDASAMRAASPARAAPAVAPITVLTAEPVHEAAACGDLNGVRALVAAAGDDPATRQQRRLDGATALHVAAAGGHAAIAAFLVGAGWRLGAVTDEGATPLHVAAASGHGPALAAMLTAAFARVRAVVEGVTAGVASRTAAATATATAAATAAAASAPLPGNDEELRRAVAAEDPDCRTWLRVALAAGHGEAALAGALALPPPSVSGAAAAVLAAAPVGVDAEWWLTDALGSGSASSTAVLPQLLGLLSDEQLLALASRPGPHGPTPPAAWVRLSLQNSSAAPALAALLPRLPRGVLQRLFDFDGCGLPPGLVSVQPHPAAQLVASVAATGAASAAWLAAELVILCLHTLTADSVDAALSSLLVLLPHLPAAELIAVRQPRCLACPAAASLLQLALLGHEMQVCDQAGPDARAARLLLRHFGQHWELQEGGEWVHAEAPPLPAAGGAGVPSALAGGSGCRGCTGVEAVGCGGDAAISIAGAYRAALRHAAGRGRCCGSICTGQRQTAPPVCCPAFRTSPGEWQRWWQRVTPCR